MSSINWKALKLTVADDQLHQLGETIYKHVSIHKSYDEHIVAKLHGILWICWKRENKWNRPFITI